MHASYRGVFPVVDDFLQVGGRVEQEVLPPFIPVHRHGAVHIDTVEEQRSTDGHFSVHRVVKCSFYLKI